jgi:hypothetical protein
MTLGGANTVALLIAKNRRCALLLGGAGAIALLVTEDSRCALLFGRTNPIALLVTEDRRLGTGHVDRERQKADCDQAPNHSDLLSVP